MNKSLIKSAVAHRRLARRYAKKLRVALQTDSFDVARLVRAVDANRRCSAMDCAAAKEVAS